MSVTIQSQGSSGVRNTVTLTVRSSTDLTNEIANNPLESGSDPTAVNNNVTLNISNSEIDTIHGMKNHEKCLAKIKAQQRTIKNLRELNQKLQYELHRQNDIISHRNREIQILLQQARSNSANPRERRNTVVGSTSPPRRMLDGGLRESYRFGNGTNGGGIVEGTSGSFSARRRGSADGLRVTGPTPLRKTSYSKLSDSVENLLALEEAGQAPKETVVDRDRIRPSRTPPLPSETEDDSLSFYDYLDPGEISITESENGIDEWSLSSIRPNIRSPHPISRVRAYTTITSTDASSGMSLINTSAKRSSRMFYGFMSEGVERLFEEHVRENPEMLQGETEEEKEAFKNSEKQKFVREASIRFFVLMKEGLERHLEEEKNKKEHGSGSKKKKGKKAKKKGKGRNRAPSSVSSGECEEAEEMYSTTDSETGGRKYVRNGSAVFYKSLAAGSKKAMDNDADAKPRSGKNEQLRKQFHQRDKIGRRGVFKGIKSPRKKKKSGSSSPKKKKLVRHGSGVIYAGALKRDEASVLEMLEQEVASSGNPSVIEDIKSDVLENVWEERKLALKAREERIRKEKMAELGMDSNDGDMLTQDLTDEELEWAQQNSNLRHERIYKAMEVWLGPEYSNDKKKKKRNIFRRKK